MSTSKHASTDHSALAAELAEGIGEAVPQGTKSAALGHFRIVVGKRTLAYVGPRKDGVMLDFKAADLEGAPARHMKDVVVKGDRARLRINGKGKAAGRALLQYAAARAAKVEAPAAAPAKPRRGKAATHEGRDELITEALGVAPGQVLAIDVDLEAMDAGEES